MAEDTGQRPDTTTLRKYLSLLRIIPETQHHLVLYEVVMLALDLAVFLFTLFFTVYLQNLRSGRLAPIDVTFIILCLAVGLSISIYWVAMAMRGQLKLKLRFFQARYLERKMGHAGESLFTDEAYFNKDYNKLESPDKVESIEYPSTGPLALDGFVGAARPRHFSWFMPGLFSCIYLLLFFWVVLTFVVTL